jgi:alpha-L-fucosidase
VTPNPDGRIPESDVNRLKEFGDEIKRRFSTPLAKTSGTGKKQTIKLPKSSKINHILLQEDISQGERVRAFLLEGKTKNGWQSIFEGSVIGHKFIHVFEDIEVSQVRLAITESKGDPILRGFEVFDIDN